MRKNSSDVNKKIIETVSLDKTKQLRIMIGNYDEIKRDVSIKQQGQMMSKKYLMTNRGKC